ncbi:MAG: hypothetical protein O7B99_14895 [Planctomycetota bacterium]|nr:hypothetical protein [Planctomycetota bacterium]
MRRNGVWIALALGFAAVGLAVVLPGAEREAEAVSPASGFRSFVDSPAEPATRKLVEVTDERDRETEAALAEAAGGTVADGE